jgi:hypothetical protein
MTKEIWCESLYFSLSIKDKARGSQTVGCARRGGAQLLLSEGASRLYEAHMFVTKYGRRVKYIFLQALCLVETYYLSLSTGRLLAPN